MFGFGPSKEQRAIEFAKKYLDVVRSDARWPETQDEMALQSVFCTAFGLVFAYGLEVKMSPPQIHAVAIGIATKLLGLDAQRSAFMAQEAINATKPDYHPGINELIHLGISYSAAMKKSEIPAVLTSYFATLDNLRQIASQDMPTHH